MAGETALVVASLRLENVPSCPVRSTDVASLVLKWELDIFAYYFVACDLL